MQSARTLYKQLDHRMPAGHWEMTHNSHHLTELFNHSVSGHWSMPDQGGEMTNELAYFPEYN